MPLSDLRSLHEDSGQRRGPAVEGPPCRVRGHHSSVCVGDTGLDWRWAEDVPPVKRRACPHAAASDGPGWWKLSDPRSHRGKDTASSPRSLMWDHPGASGRTSSRPASLLGWHSGSNAPGALNSGAQARQRGRRCPGRAREEQGRGGSAASLPPPRTPGWGRPPPHLELVRRRGRPGRHGPSERSDKRPPPPHQGTEGSEGGSRRVLGLVSSPAGCPQGPPTQQPAPDCPHAA